MSRRCRRRICAGLFLLLVLGCATPAPVVDVDHWLEVRTPAFTLYGNLEEPELLDLAGELALFDAIVRRVTNTRIGESHLPARFYVLRDGSQAHSFMPAYAAGVIYPTLDGYRSVLGGDRSAFWTRHVLLHEYTHYVLRGDRHTPLPRWYDEGMSEFLAYTGVREDVIELGRTATLRLMELGHSRLEPLDKMFSPERRRFRTFYATAWALVHHLNTQKALNQQSLAFVRRLVRGEDWRSAFEASFEPSVEELEASLSEHVAFLQRGGRRAYLLPLDRIDVPDDPVASPVAPAEIAYQLGDVARSIASWDETESYGLRMAQALFRRALELDPAHPRAEAALAWTLAAQGRFDRAAAELGKAGGESSGDPEVALDLARIAELRAEAAAEDDAVADSAARRLIERAVALAPEAPAAYAELGRYLDRQGDSAAAIAAYERARSLGVWWPPLEVELARRYLDREDRERAIAILRPVAADEHGGAVAKEARRLLKRAGAS